MSNYSDLSANTIVVTGAFGNIGRAFCEYLAPLAPRLILLDLPGSTDSEHLRMLSEMGAEVEVFPVNLENRGERKRVFRDIYNSVDMVDVLVNNAALVGSHKLQGWITQFSEQSLDTWDRAQNVNLSAPFELVQCLSAKLQESPKASVINLGSIYGEFGPDWRLYENTEMGNPAAYSASKGGLLQLTRWMATTLAPKIRVNSISPGGIKNAQSPEFIRLYEARTPMRRMANVDDIVRPMAFLASSDSRYITGQNLRVDGGWSVW